MTMENHHFSIGRYIFIHGCFSIVMFLGFGGCKARSKRCNEEFGCEVGWRTVKFEGLSSHQFVESALPKKLTFAPVFWRLVKQKDFLWTRRCRNATWSRLGSSEDSALGHKWYCTLPQLAYISTSTYHIEFMITVYNRCHLFNKFNINQKTDKKPTRQVVSNSFQAWEWFEVDPVFHETIWWALRLYPLLDRIFLYCSHLMYIH